MFCNATPCQTTPVRWARGPSCFCQQHVVLTTATFPPLVRQGRCASGCCLRLSSFPPSGEGGGRTLLPCWLSGRSVGSFFSVVPPCLVAGRGCCAIPGAGIDFLARDGFVCFLCPVEVAGRIFPCSQADFIVRIPLSAVPCACREQAGNLSLGAAGPWLSAASSGCVSPFCWLD